MLKYLNWLPPRHLSLGIGATVGLIVYSIFKLKRLKTDNDWVFVGHVQNISLYPIKGLPGFEVGKSESEPEVEVTNMGLKCGSLRDRAFILGFYDTDGKFQFVTMRSKPKLALIQVTHDQNFEYLELSAPGVKNVNVHFPSSSNSKVDVEVWRSNAGGFLCDDEINQWFSHYLKEDNINYVLVCAIDQNHVPLKPRRPQEDEVFGIYMPEYMENLYSDCSPVNLISNLSHDNVNQKIIANGSQPINPRIWKSNACVKLSDKEEKQSAFAEDQWGEVKIGKDVHLKRTKPCSRCMVTTVDYDNGKYRKDREPLKTLRKFRLLYNFGVSPIFGINLAVKRSGAIQVQMPVFVKKERFRPLHSIT